MFPRRIKDVGVAPAGPYPNPMGFVVVPFFNFPNSTQIELTGLRRLALGSSVVRKARIAAARNSGERNEEKKQEAQSRLHPLHSGTTAHFAKFSLTLPGFHSTSIKNRQSRDQCH